MTNELQPKAPIVLTIAGFDPSGGAGVIADIRTIEKFGCRAVASITSITFQSSRKYFGAVHQPADFVRKQIEAIVRDYSISAVKIGMLPTAGTVAQVAWLIDELKLPAPVIDPVMESTSGGQLMDDDAFDLFVTELLPLVHVVTPNIPEAEKLAGLNIRDEESMRQAAARIREIGARAVLIKGGHLKPKAGDGSNGEEINREAIDLLDAQGRLTVFRGGWMDVPNVRGTGCMLSSAIACGLAKGDQLELAIYDAKEFVSQAIENSKLETPDSKPNSTRS